MLRHKQVHAKDCNRFGTKKDCPSQSKNKCSFWVIGRHNGKRYNQSLRTPDEAVAVQQVNDIVLGKAVEPEKAPTAVVEAIKLFFVQETARGSSESTLKTFHKFLDGAPKRQPYPNYSHTLVEFSREKGIEYLNDFDLTLVTEFRNGWKTKREATVKQSEKLKQFFKHAHDMDWIKTNPAGKLKPPPKPKAGDSENQSNVPVVAFNAEERKAILSMSKPFVEWAIMD